MSDTTLLEALKRVHKEATKHRDGERTADWFLSNDGICTNVWQAGFRKRGVYSTMESIFMEWPNYSGYITYPVPSPMQPLTPRDVFYCTSNLWIGDYGDLRMDLLNHCIKTLEREL